MPKRSFDELIDFEDVLAEDLLDAEFKAEWERLAAARAIAELVIEARKSKGLSQTALARIARVSQPVIARIEAGEHSPTVETLVKLSHALEVEIVVGITPANRQEPIINVPSARAKTVSESAAAFGSRLVVSAA